MTFLDPTSAILGACLGVPALLAVYLLKLRRRPVRVSSTLLWQSAAEDLQANVPLRWLRASWLLLLHLVILGMLITALGRPTLSGGAAAPSRFVIMIDRSASMSCTDGPGGVSRLTQAKARAVELAGRALDSGAAVAVVSFAARPSVESGLSSSRGAVSAAIEAIRPTDQPADLPGALRVVESLAADPEESAGAALMTACIISDGSFAGDATPALAGAVASFEPVGGPGAPNNAGVVSFSARRDYDDPGTVRVFARLLNASPSAIDVPVSLRLDGEVLERRAVHLPGAPAPGATPITADAVVTFELRSARGGNAVLTIDRPDALAADNSAALVIPEARKPRIVLVKPANDAPRATLVPASLLEDALSELDAASFRSIDAAEYERLAAAGSLGRVELWIFDRVRPGTIPPGASLSVGAGLPVPGLDLIASSTVDRGAYVLSWERTHPLLRDVALDQVFIASALVPVAPATPRSDIKELATGPTGPLLLSATDGGNRRLVLTFDVAGSNWPLQVSFPVFLASAVDFLTLRAEESAGRAFTTAEPVEIIAPPGVSRVELRRIGNEPPVSAAATPSDDVTIPVLIEPARAGAPVPAGLFERSGLYRITPAGEQSAVAVNLVDPVESGCAVRTTLKIGAASLGAGSVGAVPREIWLWFVLGAGALLIVEWIAFAARARA